ncbi:MAG: hypothetical protein ACOVNU_11610 [Candidatus Kapaibacteriota bacterium]
MMKETLEQAAERLYPLSAISKKLFIRGAKWQQEQYNWEKIYGNEGLKDDYIEGFNNGYNKAK